jgi:hypothetical protein
MVHNRVMNGLLRLATILTASLIAASTLAACGSDEDEPVPGIEAGSATSQSSSGEKGGNGDGASNGPESAGDRKPEAPDNSISDRPGGPNQSNGSQQDNGGSGGSGSGGVSPPLPSPAR